MSSEFFVSPARIPKCSDVLSGPAGKHKVSLIPCWANAASDSGIAAILRLTLVCVSAVVI